MQKDRPKKRLIWVDWLLLALLGAMLFGGIRFFKGRRVTAEATVPISYTLCLESVPRSLGEANGSWDWLLPAGAIVSNANATAQMGRVSDVLVREHRVPTVQESKTVMLSVPDRVDVYVTVKGFATAPVGEGLRMGDIRVAAGERGDFYIGSYYAGGALTVFVERGDEDG